MTDLRMFDQSKVRGIIEGLEADCSALRARVSQAENHAAIAKSRVEAAAERERVLREAWGDIRQHSSDGDEAVECCAEHYDAMDRAALTHPAAPDKEAR